MLVESEEKLLREWKKRKGLNVITESSEALKKWLQTEKASDERYNWD